MPDHDVEGSPRMFWSFGCGPNAASARLRGEGRFTPRGVCPRARRAGTVGAVNGDDLADATRAAKATEALLRDARSALRRVEKLTDAALATDDADAHHLAGAAQRMLEQLVDHLVLAKQKRNRAVQRAQRQVR
jgi:ribosomal protein S20